MVGLHAAVDDGHPHAATGGPAPGPLGGDVVEGGEGAVDAQGRGFPGPLRPGRLTFGRRGRRGRRRWGPAGTHGLHRLHGFSARGDRRRRKISHGPAAPRGRWPPARRWRGRRPRAGAGRRPAPRRPHRHGRALVPQGGAGDVGQHGRQLDVVEAERAPGLVHQLQHAEHLVVVGAGHAQHRGRTDPQHAHDALGGGGVIGSGHHGHRLARGQDVPGRAPLGRHPGADQVAGADGGHHLELVATGFQDPALAGCGDRAGRAQDRVQHQVHCCCTAGMLPVIRRTSSAVGPDGADTMDIRLPGAIVNRDRR